MVRFGPRLEKRQSVLFRLVDIGADLFAMATACARAEMLRKKGQPEAVELADLFCRYARRRIRATFRTVFRNEDVRTYAVAGKVLGGKHTWLESGMV